MTVNKGMFTSSTSEWYTPKDLYDKLNAAFHFKCDPCTTADNPLGTEIFYTKEQDGLRQEWYDVTFLNPPYGREIGEWVEKAQLSTYIYNINVVALLPARTDTKWFHDWIYKRPNVMVDFLKGRLKFTSPDNKKPMPAPFPSMICIFRHQR